MSHSMNLNRNLGEILDNKFSLVCYIPSLLKAICIETKCSIQIAANIYQFSSLLYFD